MLKSLTATLGDLVHIGLGYLSLDRASSTLSGGESQRVRMVRHLGSPLTDITYVFDEPSVGLHAHDVARLNELLLRLRDKGNTVLVVEHKAQVVGVADHVVDLGPGAGNAGGEIVYQGTVAGLRKSRTLTGRHLAHRRIVRTDVRTPSGSLRVEHATLHNLQDLAVDIPTGVHTAVTGVAGSGKSSLVLGVLPQQHPDVVVVDQGLTRGSSRSNTATWTGMLEPIRKAFAKANNVKPALFSANSEGACPVCKGPGLIYTDLQFLDTAVSVWEACEGRRFTAEVLAYELDGRNIADVLAMSVVEARAYLVGRPGGHGHADVPGRRRSRVRDPRPAAVHAVRRRAAAAQARGGDGRRRLGVPAGRADQWSTHGRRGPADRLAAPARRRRPHRGRRRAQPRRGRQRRLGDRPRPARWHDGGRVGSPARRPTWCTPRTR